MNTQDSKWLLLVDRRQGRLLCCSVTSHGRCHVEEYDTLQSDSPPKEHEVSSPIRKRCSTTYGIEDRGDLEEIKHFVRQLNEWLPGIMRQHSIEDLVVIASSGVLGELRTRLRTELKQQCDLRKGAWIHLSIRELAEHPVVRELVGLD